MTVPIKRRSPADQIRYCVDRLNEIHAQSSSEQTALIASRHLLATLAEQLDATLTEPETGLSTGAAFLVDAIRNARISELHEAFEHLGWPIHIVLSETPPIRSCYLDHVHDAHNWSAGDGSEYGCIGYPTRKAAKAAAGEG